MQDCEPPPGCPDDGFDPARCVDVPDPFTATLVDGEAVAIAVDDDLVAALGLAEGAWWTAWSDGASCARVVASFTVEAP